jgi:hypothetical protein
LAELLPNHTLPELLFLETKWASLMSYGMTFPVIGHEFPVTLDVGRVCPENAFFGK